MSVWHPLTAEDWDSYARTTQAFDDAGLAHKRLKDLASLIKRNVDWLIQSCYLPADHGCHVELTGMLAPMRKDAINWGDLSCVEVEETPDGWRVVIEEAAPDAANLQEFVRGWLMVWGFDVAEVVTEW